MIHSRQSAETDSWESGDGTKRVTSPALEALMGQPIKVLDHGFVRLVDYMGGDESIVQAARVSYGKGTKRKSDDKSLIFYLMRHWHTTPFEMCEIKLHVKMPIFVARQWVRHRTASINEYSARYSVLSKEFYMPESRHMAAQSETNHQGREESALPPEQVQALLTLLRRDSLQCYDTYMAHMNMTEDGEALEANKEGLSRELARMNLTLNYYTEMYWKINLHNLMHFLRLRGDAHAQYEIQVYAHAIQRLVDAWVPMAAEAFKEYRQGAVQFSKSGMDVVRRLVRGEEVRREDTSITKREWGEIMQALNLDEKGQIKVA
jgi:thymidylate synthase (FAD)